MILLICWRNSTGRGGVRLEKAGAESQMVSHRRPRSWGFIYNVMCLGRSVMRFAVVKDLALQGTLRGGRGRRNHVLLFFTLSLHIYCA